MKAIHTRLGRPSTSTSSGAGYAVLQLAAGLVVLAACGSVNVRPYLTPLPTALLDTLRAPPDALITEAERVLTMEGLRVRAASAQEGYLETHWYDPATQRTVGSTAFPVQRAVKLRLWADSVGLGRTQLTSEAVIRRSADPSLPSREAEMVVPPDHPGYELLVRVRDSLRGRFGG